MRFFQKMEIYYGWVIVCAASIIFMIAGGIGFSAGVIYVIVAEDFSENRRETAWISSITISSIFFIGK